jgi:integrase
MSKKHAKTAKRLPRLRVFILGAGVSAACGVPVAKDIFRAMMVRLWDAGNSSATEVHKLENHWKENPNQLLFPAPRKDGFSRSRNNVVRSGLKPILRELGISAENVGLHAFRHGLATELAESEPITVLQTQMRHADVRTTLKVYAHVIPQSQRDSMERIAKRSIGTNVPIGTGATI